MNSINTHRRFSYKDLFYKSLIFIVTVSVISYFMPKEGKFNYDFNPDKPWTYGLLQAPFDFPIYKSEAQVQKVPYMLVLGDQEVADGVVAVRSRKDGNLGVMKQDELIAKLVMEVATKAR